MEAAASAHAPASAAAAAAAPRRPRVHHLDLGVHKGGRAPPTEPPVLRLVHRDQHYLAIDKPPDVRIDGPHPHTTEKMLQAAFPGRAEELRHCHQLDYATSGVMCYATHKAAAGCAGWLFETRKTTKVPSPSPMGSAAAQLPRAATVLRTVLSSVSVLSALTEPDGHSRAPAGLPRAGGRAHRGRVD